MEKVQNFIKCENVPIFDEVLLSQNGNSIMTNKISSIQKSEHLTFIRENFGVLSEREIS